MSVSKGSSLKPIVAVAVCEVGNCSLFVLCSDCLCLRELLRSPGIGGCGDEVGLVDYRV